MNNKHSRREFILGASSVAAIAVAGCLDDVEEEIRPQYTVSSINPPAEDAVTFRNVDSTSPTHVFRVTYDTSFPDHDEPAHIFAKREGDILEGFEYEGQETIEVEVSDSDLDEQDISIVCSAGDEDYGEVVFTHNPYEGEEDEDDDENEGE